MDDQIDPQLESFWKIPISNDRIIFVDSVDSEEFGLFCWAMERSYIVGMDCEWKPSFRQNSSGTPRVSVLQIACRIYGYDDGHRLNKNGLEENFYDETKNCCRTGMVSAREEEVKVDIEEKFNSSENSFAVLGAFSEEMVNFEIGQTKCDVYYGGENFLDKEAEWRQKIFGEVGPSEGQNVQELIFLLDLLELPVSSFWRTLKTMFVSPDILKLGFKFKQDLVYLAGSFCGQDAHSCFDKVEGLARQLRCVGIDAACPSVKKADPRQLVEQAQEEKRILLTRDIKLLRRHLMPSNQAYQVKNLAKQDQLVEVIETFSLKICEYELMSRCIKCNGRFIEKSLTTNEAIAAATSEQVIPEFLIDRDLDFWQCADCRQIYWEGTQYHNAIQQFSAVCKAND